MRSRRINALTLLLAVVALITVACGSSSTTGARSAPDRLRGLVQPTPAEVGTVSLPDASHDDAEFPMRAAPGGVLLVYFGYTHCPDICPGTLAGMKLAIRKLTPAQAKRVQVAMVTVDPTRDTGPVLTKFLGLFFRDAHALRTEDPARLSAAAQPFGVQYQVAANSKGEEDVGHSALSFAVDDRGRVVDTWPFGISVAAVTHDLQLLLARASG